MSKTVITIFIVLCSALCFGDSPKTLTPKPHESYEIKDGKIFYRHGNAGLVLEAADSETIARYYSERGAPNLGNPFSSANIDLRDGTFFLISLVNRTNGNLTFTPRYVTLKIKTDASFPLDFTLLLGLLENYNAQLRKVLTNSIFHSPETIPAGTVMSKFLIFPPLKKKFKELKLEFDYLYFEDKEVRLNFYFLHANP
jgi:hypothetical protein